MFQQHDNLPLYSQNSTADLLVINHASSTSTTSITPVAMKARSIIELPKEIPVVCASAQLLCRYYYRVHEISPGGHVEQLSSSHQEQA